MRQGVALAGRIHAWDNFLYLSSLLAKALVCQGHLEEAAAVIEEAFAVMREAQLSRPFDQIESLTGAATVKLALLEASGSAGRKSALREAHTACRKALRAARVQTYWLPQALRLSGTAAWLDGKATVARGYWDQSIEAAEKDRFPLEHARTLMEIGSRTGDCDRLNQALSLFGTHGANVGKAFALHLLAQSRQQQEQARDAESLVGDYDQAVRALDAVNAGQRLAQARSQLAALKTGRQ